MNKTLLVSALLSTAILSGCAQKPKYAPLMVMPAIPENKVELVEVDLQFESTSDLDESTVQLDSHPVAANSSVVINVPSGLFEEQSTATASKQDFKTKDFFNVAEQQIERVLIRNKFRVLSRSKFEAKLRKLRDEARCDTSEYKCLVSQVSPEIRHIMEDLTKQFKDGEISQDSYVEKIQSFRDQLQTSSAGKRRNGTEKELTDISEVMRAAESGTVQADYVLQINMFDTAQKLTIKTDLRYEPEIREFLREHPGITRQFNNGHNIVECRVIGAKLNAKLVHVRTGEIAWIGEHELNEFSSGVQNVSIEMGERVYPSNVAEIRGFVQAQNSAYARQLRFGKEVAIPDFEFNSELIEPVVSAGVCEQEWKVNKQSQIKLSKQVAKELMSKIKVEDKKIIAVIVQPEIIEK